MKSHSLCLENVTYVRRARCNKSFTQEPIVAANMLNDGFCCCEIKKSPIIKIQSVDIYWLVFWSESDQQ